MEYLRFDPSPCAFPTPKVAVRPHWTWAELGRADVPSAHAMIAPRDASLSFMRARYALRQAYQLCGLGPRKALLAPAYHCRTMLDPALHLGAPISLYGLKPDLSPDLSMLAELLDGPGQAFGALLLPHYFGFPQALDDIIALCSRHRTRVIEDCSHVLLCGAAPSGTGRTGRTGDYAVSSPYKFYACEDGGLLWANHGAPLAAPPRRTPPLARELKAAYRALRDGAHPKAGTVPQQLRSEDFNVMLQHLGVHGHDGSVHDESLSPHYLANDEQWASLRCSRWIMRHTDLSRLAARRRQRYQQWVAATARLPHCSALFPTLPEGCVPYMFPLLLERADVHFHALKRLGMPVWRWDELAASDCKTARQYRLNLLHLPCHQQLSDGQMDWMVATLELVMREILAHEAVQ